MAPNAGTSQQQTEAALPRDAGGTWNLDVLLTFAGIAQAETITLGPALTGPGTTGYTCAPAVGGGCGEMLLSTSLPSVQIADPVDGTIVRWRIKGASVAPGYSLDVLRHNSDGSYTVTALTGSVTPAGNEIETLPRAFPFTSANTSS